MNLVELMDELKKSRPVFHSEADFQHALAWHIHSTHKDAKIRLETPILASSGKEFHVDCIVETEQEKIYIELKYKSAAMKTIVNKEDFNLKEQSALNWCRYDFLMDIHRLENLCDAPNKKGYAILLTNVPPLWKKSESAKEFFDSQFRVHEGRRLEGTLNWNKGVSASVREKRAKLTFCGKYDVCWRDYTKFIDTKSGIFRYCLINVEH